MKKQILNFGKALTKAEQILIKGGDGSIWNDITSCKVHCRGLYGSDFGQCYNYGSGQYICVEEEEC